MDAAIDDARIALGDDRLTFRICVGEPVTEIVEAAQDADLVVIGTHGRVGRIASILGRSSKRTPGSRTRAAPAQGNGPTRCE